MGLEAEMEVSALRYSGGTGLHGRSPLLRLQSDERLVTLIRRGNQSAFEVLVARYNSRLLAFCRHMLGSREDAEDVLQDVLTASYNAMLADDRPINVRPWLYRIARNRCLNHLRRARAVGVDSMDIHFSDNGASTADKVHERETFRQLLDDIRDLPETQRTALVLREMDALSYEQIAEAMDTTVSSVKSLLVRARVSLTEAAEARLITCEEAREEMAEIAEGMRRKGSAQVRRHVKSCSRCQVFQGQMRRTDRALAALAPVAPLALLHKLLFAHTLTHSAGSAGAVGAAGVGSGGAAGGAAAGGAAAAGTGSAGLITAGVSAVATKAAAGLAAAALVTVGTVAVSQNPRPRSGPPASVVVQRALDSGLGSAIGSTRLAGAVAPSGAVAASGSALSLAAAPITGQGINGTAIAHGLTDGRPDATTPLPYRGTVQTVPVRRELAGSAAGGNPTSARAAATAVATPPAATGLRGTTNGGVSPTPPASGSAPVATAADARTTTTGTTAGTTTTSTTATTTTATTTTGTTTGTAGTTTTIGTTGTTTGTAGTTTTIGTTGTGTTGTGTTGTGTTGTGTTTTGSGTSTSPIPTATVTTGASLSTSAAGEASPRQ